MAALLAASADTARSSTPPFASEIGRGTRAGSDDEGDGNENTEGVKNNDTKQMATGGRRPRSRLDRSDDDWRRIAVGATGGRSRWESRMMVFAAGHEARC